MRDRALMNAIVSRKVNEVEEVMLSKGIDINRDNWLEYIIQNSNAEILDLMIGKYDLDFFPYSFIPLYQATCEKDIDMFSVLLRYGANVNAVEHHSARVPLHMVVKTPGSFALKATTLLLNHAADIHAVDSFGHTPLHNAVIRTDSFSLPIIKLLLTRGANIYAVDSFGHTPLHDFVDQYDPSAKAIANGYEAQQIIQLFLRHADIGMLMYCKDEALRQKALAIPEIAAFLKTITLDEALERDLPKTFSYIFKHRDITQEEKTKIYNKAIAKNAVKYTKFLLDSGYNLLDDECGGLDVSDDVVEITGGLVPNDDVEIIGDLDVL